MEEMFFGKKLRELRLKHAKQGIHNFHKSMNTSMEIKELFDIEHGYAKPPDDIMFLQQVIMALGIPAQHDDWLELMKLYKEPFVMQKMPEGIIASPLVHKTDGTRLTEQEYIHLNEYINNHSREHNLKADAYNKEHGVS
jgi:hypothetical protein